MEEFLKGDSGSLFVFFYLLPGVFGMAVYEYLVEGEKRDIFDRVVFALSMTLVSYLIVNELFLIPLVPLMRITKDTGAPDIITGFVGTNLAYVTAVSVILSMVLAFCINHGLPLRFLRWLRLTYKTSSVDVWQDTFYEFRKYWVRITFADGRELIGWPQFFSSVGKPRELFLADATWWSIDEHGQPASVDVEGPGVYISDFSTVTAIALLRG
jgi:hypothetical protein